MQAVGSLARSAQVSGGAVPETDSFRDEVYDDYLPAYGPFKSDTTNQAATFPVTVYGDP
jgi:hypothetical protein